MPSPLLTSQRQLWEPTWGWGVCETECECEMYECERE